MKNLLRRVSALLLLASVGAASSSVACGRYWVCGKVDEDRVARAPSRLSETGLSASGVTTYEPRFPLWSDGASKRRWMWMPPGTRIDTSDMDAWVFPVGTKFWKEFTRDGVRVETRMIEKLGPDDWLAIAYLWRADGSDADAIPYGAIDAAGTAHDVPAANECVACHGGRRDFVLGFSAVQVDVAPLVAAGLVTEAPKQPIALPGNETERAALGYLHANCSHCHNQTRPAHSGPRCFDPRNKLDFTLSANALAVSDTATYRTALDSTSRILELVSRRGFGKQMPPLATEVVDAEAVSLLDRWIRGLR